jgi:hypothetical protein
VWSLTRVDTCKRRCAVMHHVRPRQMSLHTLKVHGTCRHVTKNCLQVTRQSESRPLTLTGGQDRQAPVLGGEHEPPRTCQDWLGAAIGLRVGEGSVIRCHLFLAWGMSSYSGIITSNIPSAPGPDVPAIAPLSCLLVMFIQMKRWKKSKMECM